MRHITTIIAVLALAIAAPAIAGKGNGNGNGGNGEGTHGGGSGSGGGGSVTGACTVSGNVVYGSGLPTDQVINFMVTDSSGTWGFVLGYTHDGNWSVNVPAPNGTATYEFVSRTYGPDGSKYSVFQGCSV
jgi:hypothetical protein